MSETPPLATGPLGMRLLGFARLPEDTAFGSGSPVGERDDDSGAGAEGHEPVRYVLVVLRHAGRVLLVHVRHRDCWELPGGGIEPGETPRQAAARELWEESGQRIAPDALRFAGFARTSLPDRRVLHGALFTAETDSPLGFTPTDEIAGLHWWEPAAPPPEGRVQTVDTYLVGLTAPAEPAAHPAPHAAADPH
ncbi:NUDIX hydrolase [Streptomyces avicenniae]|uniref:NUDIX hydrolase n=1 Tax=Streptomyces avicenniae TaxID=500153 RepID=UPI000699ABB2|nr:NUDIX domain-containing protein [Streptomyces avicenniae]